MSRQDFLHYSGKNGRDLHLKSWYSARIFLKKGVVYI